MNKTIPVMASPRMKSTDWLLLFEVLFSEKKVEFEKAFLR
ncbi:hypothetical protein LEP1GSC150_0969 [Leptospira interrogans serovar Copenhageni str. LT2050]|uniref:Uncharacterized protein n=1 Tax=Leptospira interrogans serovar Copenhageni str. LT2050 TaxID=1001598 RepID=M3IUA9_LEPIT|nr:hypothetical protein LEP1GSC150_0969 [Leptospira interrogans serovar Copenhageni str. LT2050]